MALDKDGGQEQLKNIPDQALKSAIWNSIAGSLIGAFEYDALRAELNLPPLADLDAQDSERLARFCNDFVQAGICEYGARSGEIVLKTAVLELLSKKPNLDYDGIVTELATGPAQERADLEKKLAATATNIFIRLKSATGGISVTDLEEELCASFTSDQIKEIFGRLGADCDCRIEGGRYYDGPKAPSIKNARDQQARAETVRDALGKWIDVFPDDGLSARGLRGSLMSMVTPQLTDDEISATISSLLLARQIVETGGWYYKKGFEPVAGRTKNNEAIAAEQKKIDLTIGSVVKIIAAVSGRAWKSGEAAPITADERKELLGHLSVIDHAAQELRKAGFVFMQPVSRALNGIELFMRKNADANLNSVYGAPVDDQEREEMLLRQGDFVVALETISKGIYGVTLSGGPDPVVAKKVPDPNPDPSLDAQKNAIDEARISEQGQRLEKARTDILELLGALPKTSTPSAAAKAKLYAQLEVFVDAANQLTALGVPFSTDGTKTMRRLKVILRDRMVINENLFRDSLTNLDDELLTTFQSLKKKTPDPDKNPPKPDDALLYNRVPVSSEGFAGQELHKFGDFENAGYTGVFYNGRSEQDAFAVEGSAAVVADGMGSYGFSGSLSRIFSEDVAASVHGAASLDKFKEFFTEKALRTLLEKIRDSSDYKEANERVKQKWSAENPNKDWDVAHAAQKNQAATTFSVLSESADGKETYYALMGDSPLIVVDRDSTGKVTGWKLLNEEGVAINAAGGNVQVSITDKNVYDINILSGLGGSTTAGVTIKPDGAIGVSQVNSDLRIGTIENRPNRLIIVASDALTKLLVESPAAAEAKASNLDTLQTLSDDDFIAYASKDPRFLHLFSLTGAPAVADLLKERERMKSRAEYLRNAAEQMIQQYPHLWNPDGTFNVLGTLNADKNDLDLARDDFTFVVTAAGPQTVGLDSKVATTAATGSAGAPAPQPDALAAKRAELLAAGTGLNDAYSQVDEMLRQSKAGKVVTPEALNRASNSLRNFLRSAAAIVGLGIGLSTEARAAAEYLEKDQQLNDAAQTRAAMDLIEKELRAKVFPVIQSAPLIQSVPLGSIAKPAAIDPQFATPGVATSVTGSFDLGGAAAPVIEKPKRPTPLEVKFIKDKDGKGKGDFSVTMIEALSNEVFYDFFQKFDKKRNPAEEFDATNPDHHDRYESAMEAYMLWREACEVFTKQASLIIEQDFGLKPEAEDLVLFEGDLENLVVANTQRVRDLIDQIKAYQSFEEDEARKENDLVNISGVEKFPRELAELEKLRQKKIAEVANFTKSLNIIAKQRGDAARAAEVKGRKWFQKSQKPKEKEKLMDRTARVAVDAETNFNRAGLSLIGAVTDRVKGVSSGSFKDRLKGLFRGKEAVDLEKNLQSTYGVGVNAAADALPTLKKREQELQLQAESAIAEYEKIENRYHQLKQALYDKEQIVDRFSQLRRNIFADTEAFKTVARLTAGRSRDIIKGMLDPATVTEDKLPDAAKSAESKLAGLRRAADFRFSRDRYSSMPEIVGSLTDEGEIVVAADETISGTVRTQLQKSIDKFTVVDSRNTALIRKTMLAYGQRGYEIGEQVLSTAITKAKAAKEDRRANVLQALLFELRAMPRT